jgi:hypothetical protein
MVTWNEGRLHRAPLDGMRRGESRGKGPKICAAREITLENYRPLRIPKGPVLFVPTLLGIQTHETCHREGAPCKASAVLLAIRLWCSETLTFSKTTRAKTAQVRQDSADKCIEWALPLSSEERH